MRPNPTPSSSTTRATKLAPFLRRDAALLRPLSARSPDPAVSRVPRVFCRGGLTPPLPPPCASTLFTCSGPTFALSAAGRVARPAPFGVRRSNRLSLSANHHTCHPEQSERSLFSQAFSLSAHNQVSRQRSPLDNSCASPYIGRMPTVDNQPKRLEFLQGTLEVLVLRSLRAAPNHAYGISQFLHQQSENEFLADNGSLYPALQRLLQRRLIAAQWRKSPNGRRAKYYWLTPLGRKQLVAASSKWLRFVEAMGRILAPEG